MSKCFHKMCDICGCRECQEDRPKIRVYGEVNCCDRCLSICVKFAYEACCRFGGTCIDVNKPCGQSAVA